MTLKNLSKNKFKMLFPKIFSGLCLLIAINLSLISLAACGADGKDSNPAILRDSVYIKTSNGVIFGMLFKPKGIETKIPAVLCLQGGGEAGLENYFYEAEFFANNGIAALICDKSGSGLSKTSKSWTQQSFEDKISEYKELLNWLTKKDEVNPKLVGLHGMSEGARLALYMSAKYPESIAFVNAVSGPIASFKENQLYAIEHVLRSEGHDTLAIKKALAMWNSYFEDVSLGKISENTLLLIQELSEQVPEIRYRPGLTSQLPERPLPQDIHFTLDGVVNQIKCPVLLQYGALDTRVDPVKSISLVPHYSNFITKVYDNTDHSMNLQDADIQPLYLEDKLDWIQMLFNKKHE